MGGSEADALVLEVVLAPEESQGAIPTGLKVGDILEVTSLETPAGLEPLAFRYRESIRSQWPDEYRFQALRRAWQVCVSDGFGEKAEPLVLQLASRQEDRTIECVQLDLEDAQAAASYAHRFNLYQGQYAKENAAMAGNEQIPQVKVAAAVGCKVMSSHMPAMIPVGAHCSLSAYPYREISKLVFTGSEDFLEMAQTFFHHVTFSSGGKELVCDIQGFEERDGSLLLLDPCVLRTQKMTVGGLVAGAVAGKAGVAEEHASSNCLGPSTTSMRDVFDKLHPKCGQLCKVFDPHRGSVKRTFGVCGVDVTTCGLGR